MGIDENTFFKQATLEIFKDIDGNSALSNIHSFLGAFMPIASITLIHFEHKKSQFQVVSTSRDADWPTPAKHFVLSEEEHFYVQAQKGDDRQVRLVSGPEKEPAPLQAILSKLGPLDSPIMYMQMDFGNHEAGGVVIHAINGMSLTEFHQKLVQALVEPFSLAATNIMRHKHLVKLQNQIEEENSFLRREIRAGHEHHIIGSEFGLKHVMDLVNQVAPTNSSVLLMGETGSGKEVIANALHRQSQRRDKPFIKINCGAIPENLIDSELFGHEKGAFTGALKQKKGRFERANKGTLFLDEIGELPWSAQVRLLRILQNKEFERVGGATTLSTDVRIIAATHRDLQQKVQDGTFREDLFYRLNVFPIAVPPLRQRLNDIPALVNYFIQDKSREMGFHRHFKPAPGALEAMQEYAWPGNVRELENVVEREIIRSNSIDGENLIYFGQNTPKKVGSKKQPATGEIVSLNEALLRHIKYALIQSGGKVEGAGGAAEILDINPSTLRGKMRKLGIRFRKN